MSHAHACYGAYKDSGVEWLGEVPTHWREVRIKDMAFLERGKFTHRPRNDPQMYDGIHPFIQTGDVARANKYVTKFKQTLSDKGTQVSKKFKKGTLLMAIAANIGDVAIVDFDTYFPDSIVGFQPNKNNVDFLFYLFSATRSELDRIKVTSTQDNLNLERLNSLVKFLPPLVEQTTIAAYLDSKTAQLDRQIGLLSQKATQYGKLKQSLINETVTRGLDKTVAMKDSGVEWINEVPAHWKVKRVKEISTVVNGATPKSSVAENWDGELPWVTTDDLGKLNTKFITDTKRKITEKGYASCGTSICPIGSVVISGRAPIGHIGILSIKASSNQGCKTLVLNHRAANNLFIFYSLLSSKSKLEALGRGTTFIELSTKELGLFNLPMPSLLEQQALAIYLNEKTTHIDRIVATLNRQIDKLRELRKTLINDIVTGKICIVEQGGTGTSERG